MSIATANKIKYKSSRPRFRAFEEARETISKLRTLQPFLTAQDEETLSILMDKKLMTHLEKSLDESEKGKLEQINKIL